APRSFIGGVYRRTPFADLKGPRRSGGALGRRGLQSEFRHGDLAHPELLDLAGHGGGEILDELPVGGDLERRDAAAAERGELITAHIRPRSSFHPRHHFFAVFL